MEPLGLTLTQFIRQNERLHPQATGHFSMLLNDLAMAAKVVSREANRVGLMEEVLGLTGSVNVQGEEVQKLDEYANEVFLGVLGRSGHVCIMASEEVEGPVEPANPPHEAGGYAVLFDPLDGSSNIEVNASTGTIFSIHRKRSPGPAGTLDDLIRPGEEQAAAGYILYGSSTVLVYTAGNGVHGFTLDPAVGEFLLSHRNIRIPAKGVSYSVNEGHAQGWDKPVRKFVEWLKEPDPRTGRPYSLRYIGAMVADFHRTLLQGGIFLYPADRKSPRGKIRYLYEAAPLAFVCEQAGGAASDGRQRILARAPRELHERTPVYMGSVEDVRTAQRFLGGEL